jgi:hypothetical protein
MGELQMTQNQKMTKTLCNNNKKWLSFQSHQFAKSNWSTKNVSTNPLHIMSWMKIIKTLAHNKLSKMVVVVQLNTLVPWPFQQMFVK